MRLFLLALLAVFSARAQDVMEIVHAYSEHEASRWDLSRDYTYQYDSIRRTFKRDGTLKSSTNETYEVLIVDGKPVSRLIQRDGKPVTDEEARKRQQQLERAISQARPVRSIEKQYDSFALEGEEEIDGRRAWVVSAKKSLFGGIARIHIQTRFWIDKADYECAKVQSEGGMNMISIDGWAHGANSSIVENMRMAAGVWLPKHTVFQHAAYLPLTTFPVSIVAQSQAHWELETTFSNYKKFQADSHILSLGKP